jgi:hypothetical protein
VSLLVPAVDDNMPRLAYVACGGGPGSKITVTSNLVTGSYLLKRCTENHVDFAD